MQRLETLRSVGFSIAKQDVEKFEQTVEEFVEPGKDFTPDD
jgi:hypothetical protein